MLCSHSNNEIRDYLESTKCRRKEVQKHFTQANFYDKAQSSNPCECCDNCALECSCGLQCRKGEMQFKFTECIEVENVCEQRTRVVAKEQIAELENKLQEYAQMLLKNAQGMVSYPLLACYKMATRRIFACSWLVLVFLVIFRYTRVSTSTNVENPYCLLCLSFASLEDDWIPSLALNCVSNMMVLGLT